MYAHACSWRAWTGLTALVRSYRASKNGSFCTPGRQKIVSMPFTSSIETTAWAVVSVVMIPPPPSYGGGREGGSHTGYPMRYENYDLKPGRKDGSVHSCSRRLDDRCEPC